jgi:hypothetical protein
MSKIEEIYTFILPELASKGIDDTPQHCLWALEGLRDAWKKDSDISLEKTLYQIALNGEILILKMKLRQLQVA